MFKYMKKKNIFLVLFTVIVLIILIILSFRVVKSFDTDSSKDENVINSAILKLEDYLGNNMQFNLVGQVEPIQKVDLKSEVSGKIKKLNIKIGEEVKKNDILIEVDHAILDSQLVQAQANIERIKNNLELKEAGASFELIRQSEIQLEKIKTSTNSQISQAQSALDIAKNNLRSSNDDNDSEIIKSSYENLINSIHSSIIVLDNVKNTSDSILALENYFSRNNFENVLSVLDFSKLNKAENSFYQMSNSIKEIKKEIENLSVSFNNEQILNKANALKKTLSVAQNHYYDLEATLNATITSSKLSQNDLNKTKNNITAASNSLVASNNSITAAIQNIDTSKSSYDSLEIFYKKAQQDYDNLLKQTEKDIALAQASHNLIIAKPREIDLNGLKSSIKEAQAAYNIIKENRDKAVLRAPIDGVVASVDVGLGDFVGNSMSMASILSDQGLQIKTYIDHSDLSSIKKGQEVVIEQSLAKGVVDRISPMINDKTKKVEIIILVYEGCDKLVSGQHANIDILLDQIDNTLPNFYFLPLAAVKTTNNGSFVYTLDNDNKVKDIKIEIGQIVGDKIEVFNLENIDFVLASTRGIEISNKINIQ